MHKTLKFKIQGISPLLQHNGQLADPLNDWAIELAKVSKKKTKTFDDHGEMSRIEWYGSLYLNEKGRVIVPGENIEALLNGAARSMRLGKAFSAGVLSDGNWPLIYDGPKAVDELWADKRFRLRMGVKLNGKTRVMRTRPIFRGWSLEFEVSYLADLVNKEQVIDAVKTGGRTVALCDYRPKYGRYEVV